MLSDALRASQGLLSGTSLAQLPQCELVQMPQRSAPAMAPKPTSAAGAASSRGAGSGTVGGRGALYYVIPALLAVAAAALFNHPIMSRETTGSDPALAPAGSSFVQLSHGRVRYVLHPAASGELERCVVLLHGLTWYGAAMEPTAEALRSEGRCTVVMDFYGRGFSQSPAVPHTVDLFVGQVAELLFHLGIQDPVTLVGWSMGGAVSARFCEVYPDRVEKLVLVAAAGLPVRVPMAARLAKIPYLGDFVAAFLGPYISGGQFDKEWSGEHSGPEYEKWVGLFRGHYAMNPILYRSALSSLRHFALGEMEDTFRAIAKHPRPVLLLWGDGDNTCPYENGVTLDAFMPNAKLVTVHGARHAILLEFKSQAAGHIVKFLKV